jgi:hypothetical protein
MLFQYLSYCSPLGTGHTSSLWGEGQESSFEEANSRGPPLYFLVISNCMLATFSLLNFPELTPFPFKCYGGVGKLRANEWCVGPMLTSLEV